MGKRRAKVKVAEFGNEPSCAPFLQTAWALLEMKPDGTADGTYLYSLSLWQWLLSRQPLSVATTQGEFAN